MKIKILIITFSLLIIGFVNVSFSYDHVRYVDINNGDNTGNTGLTADSAWENIFYAMSQINVDNGIAPGQSTILYVAPGTYPASAGGTNDNITIGISDFTIMGNDSASTIIDGTDASDSWTEGIRTQDGVNNAAIIGLTIKNFQGAGVRFYSGTGNSVSSCEISGGSYGVSVYAGTTEASPGIYNNTIKDNFYGILLESINAPVSPEIMGNSIFRTANDMSLTIGINITTGTSESNPVIKGNTIFNYESGIETMAGSVPSSPEILNNRIYDNTTGIFLRGNYSVMTPSLPKVINNIIYKTTGTMTDGIYLYCGTTDDTLSAEILHNTIDGGSGSGIYVDQGTGSITADIKYCIITNFSDADGAYGIYNNLSSTLNIDYVNIWNNAPNTTDLFNCTVTTTQYNVDPQYTAEYSLQVASPCIDVVPVSESDPVNYDIIGTSRPRRKDSDGLNQHDLGAYEYPYKAYEFTMPGGNGQPTDYRMMTLPIELASASLTTILTDAFGIYDDKNWRAFVWDGAAYAEFGTDTFDSLTYNTALSSHAGRSFWVINLDGKLSSDTSTFEGVLAANMQPTTIPLSAGWNMIALPWPSGTGNSSIELGNVVVKEGVQKFWLTSANNTITDQCVWDYNGVSGYTKFESATDLLVPEKGYWINVVSVNPVELVIPPDNGVYMTASKRVARRTKASYEIPPAPPGSNLSASGGNGCFIKYLLK